MAHCGEANIWLGLFLFITSVIGLLNIANFVTHHTINRLIDWHQSRIHRKEFQKWKAQYEARERSR